MSNKKVVIIFLVLLTAVFLIGAGYFLYKLSYSDDVIITDQPSITPQQSVVVLEPTPVSSEVVEREVEPIEVETAPIKESVSTTTSTLPATNKRVIKFTVPFAAQAPFGEWTDSKQQNGCEEISALMSVSWARGTTFTLEEAKERVIAISDWEQKMYGSYQDTSVADTVKRIFKEYFEYHNVDVVENITISDMIKELEKGNLVAVPANGKLLHNPFFTAPGPETHMLVVIGYDYTTKEFITNEPGTRHGQGYRYKQEILFEAIRDYPTGNHKPIIGVDKNIIVVRK